MRDHVAEDNSDIERMVARIGAPPAAPLKVVRQQLERDPQAASASLFLRLRGAILPRAGQ
jgi:hypothetical protein